MNNPHYVFLFLAKERTWNLRKGAQKPNDKKFWVVRSVPGNLVASGDTFEKACQALTEVLDREFERHSEDVRGWYTDAISRADADEAKQILKVTVMDVQSFQNHDSFKYAMACG
jgi:hypothetical protein